MPERDDQSRRRKLALLLGVGVFPFLINGAYNVWLARVPLLFWATEVVVWGVLPGSIFWTVIKGRLVTTKDLGMTTSIWGVRSLPLLAVLSVAMIPVTYLLYRHTFGWASRCLPSTPIFSYQSTIPKDPVLRQAALCYYALTAGLVEEFYYRSLFRETFRCYCSSTVALVAASASLFSLVHWEGNIANLVATFVLGIALATVYERLRNIWPLVVGHIVTDYLWFSQ